MVKKSIHLNEDKLKGIIRESVKRILKESGYNQFSDYDFASVDPYGDDDGFGDNHGYGRLDGYWAFNGAYVNISDIDGVVEFDIEPRCEGCKGSFKIVGKEADDLKRDIEECAKECGDVSVAIWNCVKDMIGDNRLNESMLKDYNEFDNVPDDFVESLDGQYYEVTVPDWCLPYLVNGDEEGYTEEEIGMMDNFINSFNGKLWYGLNVGDACVPMDGVSPSFCSSNDVGGDACDCYRFCLPMKEAERGSVDGEVNETRLKRAVRESINEILNGDLDDDEVVEYMNSFDSEESGSFNVVQYKVTLDGGYHAPEKILDKTGLSKEEAWEVFKEAAEYAYKYDWDSVNYFYGTKDYIEWPIVSSEVDGVLGKRRVSFPEDGAFEIANVIENAKKQNRGEGGYKELCDNFLKHAKETFFSGKHEYRSW